MTRLRPTMFALALLAAWPAATALGALYKWTDAQGHVHYSDQPPQGEVKTEQMRGAPPPANPNAAKELAQREAEFRKRQSDAANAVTKASKQQEDADRLAAGCAQVKDQLRQLSESQLVIYRYNAKGEREVMDEDARGRERARLNGLLRESKCPP